MTGDQNGTFQAVQSALTGPFDTIRTPFLQDGSIDEQGVRKMIDLMLSAGAQVTMLTVGNSHFHCMTVREIERLTELAVEHTANRAMVVAADYQFATDKAVEFARYCASTGVDVLMLRPPEWDGTSLTVESLVEHFAAVGRHIPVMMVTNIFMGRAELGLEAIAAIRDRVDSVVAVKEDLGGVFAQNVCALVHGRWAVVAGGGWRSHLNMLPFGCDGFMCKFMSFSPAVTGRYWEAVKSGDMSKAVALNRQIDMALETFMAGFPGGRDAAIHGLFEIFGIAQRWRRKPYHSLTDQQMQKLRGYVRQQQWC